MLIASIMPIPGRPIEWSVARLGRGSSTSQYWYADNNNGRAQLPRREADPPSTKEGGQFLRFSGLRTEGEGSIAFCMLRHRTDNFLLEDRHQGDDLSGE